MQHAAHAAEGRAFSSRRARTRQRLPESARARRNAACTELSTRRQIGQHDWHGRGSGEARWSGCGADGGAGSAATHGRPTTRSARRRHPSPMPPVRRQFPALRQRGPPIHRHRRPLRRCHRRPLHAHARSRPTIPSPTSTAGRWPTRSCRPSAPPPQRGSVLPPTPTRAPSMSRAPRRPTSRRPSQWLRLPTLFTSSRDRPPRCRPPRPRRRRCRCRRTPRRGRRPSA